MMMIILGQMSSMVFTEFCVAFSCSPVCFSPSFFSFKRKKGKKKRKGRNICIYLFMVIHEFV